MPRLRFQAGSLTKASERARRRAQRILKPALRRMAALAAQTAREALSEQKLAKATRKEDAVADDVMQALYAEFAELAKKLKQPLTDATFSGLKEAVPQIDIDDADMLSDANDAAQAWAENRAAELVGMKWVDGELVENPNAKWAISDTIREKLKSILADAFGKETNLDDIISAVQEAGEFSDYRAEMIARTEVSRAQIQGNLSLWKESGLVESYDWLMSEDEDVCEECQDLADGGPYEFGNGPIPIDDSHPNCRCVIASNEIAMPKAASQKSDIRKPFKQEAVKMPDTTKAVNTEQHFFLTLPITKFDEEQRIVEGIATAEVLDTQGDIVDFPAAIDAFKSWEGNIREQHDPKKAVGHAVEWSAVDDQKAIKLTARISKGAQDTWEKVKDGTLKYFSIGCPFGQYERKAEVVKVDGKDKNANRLFLKGLSEVSLVDKGACPAAKIGLWKSEDGPSEVLETESVEKLTEGASDYADPGWQEDKKKRYPLDTEEHVRAAASYFGRPKNRKKYSADQQKKIDAKIEAAKKKFKIGEYAEKSDGTMDLCKYSDGSYSPVDWISLNDYNPEAQQPVLYYVPRSFGDVWEDTEDVNVFPLMGTMLGRTIANILAARIPGDQQRQLLQASFDEFMEEIEDELMEADEQAAELTEGAQKFTRPQLTKVGARHNKEDMATIQAVHDHSVKLGAACAPKEEKSADPVALVKEQCSLLEKAFEPLKALAAVNLLVMTQEQIEKLAGGASLDKVMEAATQKALEVKTDLEGRLASKEEVAKVQEITSKHEGDIARAGTAIEGVTKRLEVVEKQPAIATLPVSRPPLGGMSANGAADTPEDQEMLILKKLQNDAADPLTKQAIGNQIAIRMMKRG